MSGFKAPPEAGEQADFLGKEDGSQATLPTYKSIEIGRQTYDPNISTLFKHFKMDKENVIAKT